MPFFLTPKSLQQLEAQRLFHNNKPLPQSDVDLLSSVFSFIQDRVTARRLRDLLSNEKVGKRCLTVAEIN